MYGIIHKEIFDSTLMAEGHEVTYVFMSLVTLADDDDVVRMSITALALRINMPLNMVEHAIKRLEMEDRNSDSQAFNGRRIVALADIKEIESNRGWFIVNREKYIDIVKKQNRKKTNARHYARMHQKSESGGNGKDTVLKEGKQDTAKTTLSIIYNLNNIEGSRKVIPPEPGMVEIYVKKKSLSVDPESFWDFYESKGWKIGNDKMKDWQAAARGWHNRNGKTPEKPREYE